MISKEEVITSKPLSIDAYRGLVGSEIGVSEWFSVEQASIAAFAAVTRDDQPIHLDVDAGIAAGFGGTIAHGFLTLSLLSAMLGEVLPPIGGCRAKVNAGFDKIRFLAPVPAGARVRGRFTLKSVEEREKGSLRSLFGAAVEIEGGARPALVADWIVVFFF